MQQDLVQRLQSRDITVPPQKQEIIQNALNSVDVITRDFRRGLLTEQERDEKIIEIWQAYDQ